LFYPAGTVSGLVRATYSFGYVGLCNTKGIYDVYAGEGGTGHCFSPNIDPNIFHAEQRQSANDSDPLKLFCYARPGHPRNGFETLSEALRKVKSSFGGDLEILTAGSDWDPKTYGLDGVVQNLGLLPYRATAALYRGCDAGAVMMMTCHPSYLPLELMACGCLVITNRNRHNTWLLEDRENCLLAEPSPSALAEVIEEGLRDEALRARISGRAAETMRAEYSDWDAEMERAYRYMIENV
jgi:O-antigen biosynthesis protein